MQGLKIKDGSVNIWGLQPQMQPVLKYAEEIWTGLGYPFVVTSARDGLHSPGSAHYYGYAVDLRTWDANGQQLDHPKKAAIASKLRTRLRVINGHYDLVIHETHIHVEFDWWRASGWR